MKNTLEAEDLRKLNYARFSDGHAGPIEKTSPGSDNLRPGECVPETFLDLLQTSVKWVFLFMPGAAAMHLVMLGFALLYFYNDWSFGLVGASLGILGFSTFMTMLGLGKLGELRYLRVPASLLAAGGLAAIAYSILVVFIPGDYFGFYAKLTLPLTVWVGYMVKKDTDKNLETDRAGEIS